MSVCSELTEDIELSINIYGTLWTLFKSSKTELWPILANFHDSQPFLVQLHCNTRKPKPAEDYLLTWLQMVAQTCDAPARAFLKNSKGHNAVQGCEHCVENVVSSSNKQAFLSVTGHESRTDLRFSQLWYSEHQHGPSPLIDAGILCVQRFPLDYMHLIYLGVTKRLLQSERADKKAPLL